jgi:hypothetical protein
LLFRAGSLIADAKDAPEWLPGDEFAPLRPPSTAHAPHAR